MKHASSLVLSLPCLSDLSHLFLLATFKLLWINCVWVCAWICPLCLNFFLLEDKQRFKVWGCVKCPLGTLFVVKFKWLLKSWLYAFFVHICFDWKKHKESLILWNITLILYLWKIPLFASQSPLNPLILAMFKLLAMIDWNWCFFSLAGKARWLISQGAMPSRPILLDRMPLPCPQCSLCPLCFLARWHHTC